MKNKKLSKQLAVVAAAAVLASGCTQNDAALKAYQKKAIQTKLAQMSPVEADAYIRNQMDGVHTYHYEQIAEDKLLDFWVEHDTNGTLIDEYADYAMDLLKGRSGKSVRIEDGKLLDTWAEQDTNGTLIDEYVAYAMDNHAVERETKAAAEQEFKRLRGQAKDQAPELSK